MSTIGNTPGVSSQRFVQREVIAGSSKAAFVVTTGYSLGYVDVQLNGSQLDEGDFTAADGVNVILAQAAVVGDVVRIIAWLPRGLSDGYLKSEADAAFLTKLNPSYTGTLTGGTGVVNLGSGQFYKDASGNLGIGTSSPGSSGLTVYRAGSSAISLNNAATGTAAASGFQSQIGSSGEAYIWNYSNSFIAIGTNNTERVRVDASGRVTMPYQPAFFAALSATFSHPGNVAKISGTFTVPVNIGSGFNAATQRFTAPVSGAYFLSACVSTNVSGGAFSFLSSEIWVNGSRRIVGGWDGGGTAYGKTSVSGIVYLNAGDYVELACEASKAFTAEGNSSSTILSGHLVG
jgi:hypothetical protein